jgi:hypothetical protein
LAGSLAALTAFPMAGAMIGRLLSRNLKRPRHHATQRLATIVGAAAAATLAAPESTFLGVGLGGAFGSGAFNASSSTSFCATFADTSCSPLASIGSRAPSATSQNRLGDDVSRSSPYENA